MLRRMSDPQTQTPAGWYPQNGQQRYWDGNQWTDNFAASIAPTFVRVVKVPTNGIAIAGLVMGILALLSGWWPVIGLLFSWPFIILALIFGGVGVSNSRKFGGLRKTEAWWAILLGLAPIAITTVGAIIGAIVSAVNGSR